MSPTAAWVMCEKCGSNWRAPYDRPVYCRTCRAVIREADEWTLDKADRVPAHVEPPPPAKPTHWQSLRLWLLTCEAWKLAACWFVAVQIAAVAAYGFGLLAYWLGSSLANWLGAK